MRRLALKIIWRRRHPLWSLSSATGIVFGHLKRAAGTCGMTARTRSIRLDFLIDRYTSHRIASHSPTSQLKQPLWCQRLTPKKCKLLMDTNTDAQPARHIHERTNTLSHTHTLVQSSRRDSCNFWSAFLKWENFFDCKNQSKLYFINRRKNNTIHQGFTKSWSTMR